MRAKTRGSRYEHVDRLLCQLSGAEASLVVNNNAAAVLLALESLARGREVVVSRGELIEIGGAFRIPDILARSGARLVEVGTTNRTRLADYAGAITADTALLLKVHPSNYRVVGFTEGVPTAELAELGRARGIPVLEDLGSGCFVDLEPWGLPREPTVPETIAAGVDVVTFSGDKLLGGPQAGIVLGRRPLVERLRTNPLNRALRIDKLTLAALEATLRAYEDPSTASREIPTLRMLSEPAAAVRRRAGRVVRRVPGPTRAALGLAGRDRSLRGGRGRSPPGRAGHGGPRARNGDAPAGGAGRAPARRPPARDRPHPGGAAPARLPDRDGRRRAAPRRRPDGARVVPGAVRHVVAGTAGHIDHGKSSLVLALTGIDPDRLKEEKERGITIDIGFAHLEVAEGLTVGVVDVPGHERFVRNMLAGVGGIDLAMLVIAADEGVMPQTREHLAICQLLRIPRGIVVLTKTDLTEPEWLELVQ